MADEAVVVFEVEPEEANASWVESVD